MNSLDDEIRDALRSEAGRLREVRPLRLEPAPSRRAASARPRRARRRWAWLAPITAAALVIAVAIALVTVRAEQNGPAVPPVGPQPAAPTTFPRYYTALEQVNNDGNAARVVVGDSVTGKTLATFHAPTGGAFEGTTLSGAADDRTWVVAETLGQRKPPYPPWATDGPTAWYLLRLSPGAARQVTMTRLAIKSTASDLPVTDTVLSADGRYLAAASGDAGTQRVDLRAYSVVTGRLVHAWTMVNPPPPSYASPGDLSWVNGDSTVAFTISVGSYGQLRTASVTAPGTGLLTASHLVWSEYVPAPPHGVYPPGWPRGCSQVTLAADGRTVICSKLVYHAGSTVGPEVEWLAYPLSAPTTPRVIARYWLTVPKGAGGGDLMVYTSASELIGYSFVVGQGHTSPLTIHEFIASGGTMRQLGTGIISWDEDVAW